MIRIHTHINDDKWLLINKIARILKKRPWVILNWLIETDYYVIKGCSNNHKLLKMWFDEWQNR